ncbi:MAG: response regulator [Coriobacteriales bacterium]|jgi:putative two-component system response regulator|nr:response regulator [Coriobacteriales bacterium]
MQKDKPVILAVDDDPVILNSVFETLKDDYSVRPLKSGVAALKYLESHDPELILLDCDMPEMTGFEVLEVLQSDERLKNIPVVFLTGSVSSDTEAQALKMGASDYLVKPFNPITLKARVRMQQELYEHRENLNRLVELRTEELTQANKKLVEINHMLQERDKVTLGLLQKVTFMRDHDTAEHENRTTGYARIVVNDLLENPHKGYDIDKAYAKDIIGTVGLHDFGKLAIPDAILLKPGPLTDEEFKIMQTHPSQGRDILCEVASSTSSDSLLRVAVDIVFGHHEKWDGSGYPQGIRGERIPISARIGAIADVYDALTTPRPYKDAYTPRKSLEIMYSESGTHFDPYLIEVVQCHEDDFIQIALGNQAVVS